ncbi:MAG: hypothetical protein IJY09_11670 [Lachnospiraceae bacterium]|nr:hypothetical protein [Lachnospiraceae bacterium]
MAITPIEAAAFLPKSQEVSFQRQTEVQKPVNEQVVMQTVKTERDKQNSEKTLQLTKTDQQEYRYDGSSGNGKGMLYERRSKQGKKKKETIQGDTATQGFDMRI